MENISNYKVMKEVGKTIGRGALWPVKFLYAFPTFANEVNKLDGQNWDWRNIMPTALACLALPIVTGIPNQILYESFINTINHFSGHQYNTGVDNPFIAMGIGFTTNVASGIYEVYRHTKKQMQEKLGKQGQEGKGLESVLNQ